MGERGPAGARLARGVIDGDQLCDLAREHGFALAGVAPARASEYAEHVREWLNAGKHGEMGWLENHLEKRLDPAQMVEGAKSVLLVGDLYATRNDEPDEPRAGVGRIARYARGADYHKGMRKRLIAMADEVREVFGLGEEAGLRAFVDTAPVLEREHGARAGIGWVGKHTLLIHPQQGSWFFLGGLISTVEIGVPKSQRAVVDHCGTCTRCIEACPTDAITERSVDASRCISYLTIEHRSTIDEEFHGAISDWLYGCDICQEVCPHNSRRGSARPDRTVGEAQEAYHPRCTDMDAEHGRTPDGSGFDLLKVLGWNEDDRREAFQSSAMKRAKLDMIKRNALIVLTNQALAEGVDREMVRARVEEIVGDEQEGELVRETGRVCLTRLRP
ncbi:MAG: tRNA epoxyqueuosine(34) reductase QueG [Phycisphaerales bacterium JB065]